MNEREDLKAYLDGELSPERSEQMRLAIAADPELQAEADSFRRISSDLQEMAQIPPIHGLDQALARISPSRPWLTSRISWAMPSVFCLAVAFGMSLLPGRPSLVRPEISAASEDRPVAAERDLKAKSESAAARASASEIDQDAMRDQRTKSLRAPSAAAPQETGAGSPLVLPTPQESVRDTKLRLEVASVTQAQSLLLNEVARAEGVVESPGTPTKTEVLTIFKAKIPTARFQDILERTRSLGHVVVESQSGPVRNLTPENARAILRTQKRMLSDYKTMLQDAESPLAESPLRAQIDETAKSIQELEEVIDAQKDGSEFSTLEAVLIPRQTATPAPARTEADVPFVNRAGLYFLYLSPLWLPLTVWLFLRRRRV